MPGPAREITFNVETATKEELEKIQHQIIKRLTADAQRRTVTAAAASDEVAYNSHGSQHTNHSPA